MCFLKNQIVPESTTYFHLELTNSLIKCQQSIHKNLLQTPPLIYLFSGEAELEMAASWRAPCAPLVILIFIAIMDNKQSPEITVSEVVVKETSHPTPSHKVTYSVKPEPSPIKTQEDVQNVVQTDTKRSLSTEPDEGDENSFVSFSSHNSTPFDSMLLAHSQNLRAETDNIRLNICRTFKLDIVEFAKVTPIQIKNCSALNKYTIADSLLKLLSLSDKVCAVIGGRRLSDSNSLACEDAAALVASRHAEKSSSALAAAVSVSSDGTLKESLQAIHNSILDIKKSESDAQNALFKDIQDQLEELRVSIAQFRKPRRSDASTPELLQVPPFSVQMDAHVPPEQQQLDQRTDVKSVPCMSSYQENFIDGSLSAELMTFLDGQSEKFGENCERGHSVISFGQPYQYNGAKASVPLSKTFPGPISKLAEQIKNKFPDTVINQCLVNKYTDGNSILPEHSDDEDMIVFGSDIYTISLGDTREVTFRRLDGSEETVKKAVEGGSIYTMSRESQSHWTHRIDSSPEASGLRYSITFRYVSQNGKDATLIQGDSNTRFLKFGSGKGTFGEKLPGKRMQCFTIDQIDPRACMGYKNVVIHCGINDIRRPQADVRECAHKLTSKLDQISRSCIGSRIIVSPILPTKSPHLNQRAILFNNLLFDHINRVNPKIGCLDFNSFLNESGLLADQFGRFRDRTDAIHLGSTGIFTLSRIIIEKIRGNYVDGRAFSDVVRANTSNQSRSGS